MPDPEIPNSVRENFVTLKNDPVPTERIIEGIMTADKPRYGWEIEVRDEMNLDDGKGGAAGGRWTKIGETETQTEALDVLAEISPPVQGA